MPIKLNIFCTLLLAIAFPSLVHAELILGTAPQLSVTVMAKTWSPYVEYLSKEIGEPIQLKLYSNRMDFEEDLRQGKLDLFYGNPAYAVVGKLKFNYQPLLRSDDVSLQGILVVKKDSGLNTVEDVKNKTIAFPDETAFAASLYIRNQLDRVIKLDYQAVFVQAHDNVYRSVLVGKYPVGSGVKSTLNREPEALRDQLRIIYETPELKSHPLSSHPRVTDKVRQAILQATLKLDESAEGKIILKEIKLSKPVQADFVKDYQEIETFAKQVYDYLL